jgi:hypothetical protein
MYIKQIIGSHISHSRIGKPLLRAQCNQYYQPDIDYH